MEIDPEAMRAHYASLSDEALIQVNRDDLTDVGRHFYDVEMASRKLAAQASEPMPIETNLADAGTAPDWKGDAVLVFEEQIRPGRDGAADRAASAMEALKRAGIPCDMTREHVEPDPIIPYDAYRITVPSHAWMLANNILDRDVFNADFEDKWRAHFPELSDSELLGLDVDNLFADTIRRAEGVKRAYGEELRRRGLMRDVSRA